MNITAKIYNMICSTKKGLAVFLWLGICLFFISPVLAATVEDTCGLPSQSSRWKTRDQRNTDNCKDPLQWGSYPSNQCLQSPLENTWPTSYLSLRTKDCNPQTLKDSKGESCTCNYLRQGQCWREHQGMDLHAAANTNVYAVADGVVHQIRDETTTCMNGGGRAIILKHQKPDGTCYTSTYMHLNKINHAAIGKYVSKGSFIGKSGGSNCKGGKIINTGTNGAYTPHLHIEIRNDPKCKGERGTVLEPTCDSIQALCDKNTPISDPPLTESDADYGPNGGIEASLKANATLGGCGKLYSENNLSEFHQRGEAGGDPAAFNKCAKGDSGGCSYGASQMVCYQDSSKWKNSTIASYLKHLQQNDPQKYKALEVGGSLSSTIQTACNPNTANTFYAKWKALADSDSSFKSSQTKYIENTLTSYGRDVLKNAGLGALLNRSPEMDMVILAGSVAGAGPMKNNFLAVQKALSPKTLAQATDEEIISAYYDSYAAVMYSSYTDTPERRKIREAAAKRGAIDKKMALESLAIRKEMQNNNKTLEEASQAVTGKRACEENEYPTGNASSVYYGASGNYAGGSISVSDESGDHECNAQNYRNSFQGCIFCDVFGILFNTASVLAKKSFNALASGVIGVVCVGFALWLGMTIMPFVASMENKGNPGILIKTILNKAFLILVIVFLLRMESTEFFRLALEPLFNTGFKLAQLAVAGEGGETCKNLYHILTDSDGAGLPSSMGVSILCTIETIQGKLLDIMSIGSTSICVSIYIKSWHHIQLLPHLGYLLVGIILWVAALMFMVIYPFLLIDSVLQLCVATALLPAAIGSFAFDWTKHYAKKMWNVFLNCMFNFIFLSLIILILTNGLNKIVTEIITTELLQTGAGSDFDTILGTIGWWSVNFLKLVFYLVLGWSALREVSYFAGKFAGGLSLGIGNMVGGLAANVTHKASFGALSLGSRASSKVVKTGGRLIADKYNNFRTNRRVRRIENSSKASIDENGNRVLERRTITGRKVTETLQTNPDGTQSLTRQKGSRFGFGGNKAVSADQYIKNKKRYDKDGNVIREEMSMTFAAGRSLLNRDGTRNEVAVHAIRTGSGMSNDDVDKAIMSQMIRERMSGIEDADMSKEFKSRSTSRSVDASGREVFTVTQTNKDGSTSTFQMTKGDKRDMLTFTKVSKSGKAVSYSSDGIINKKSTYNVDAEGNVDERSVKNNYAFAKSHRSDYFQSMDSNGKFNPDIPVDEIMMSQEDMALFQEQIATYGKDQAMGEFNK